MKKIVLNVNLFDEILLTGTKNQTISIEPNENGELKLVFEKERSIRQCTETDSSTLEKDFFCQSDLHDCAQSKEGCCCKCCDNNTVSTASSTFELFKTGFFDRETGQYVNYEKPLKININEETDNHEETSKLKETTTMFEGETWLTMLRKFLPYFTREVYSNGDFLDVDCQFIKLKNEMIKFIEYQFDKSITGELSFEIIYSQLKYEYYSKNQDTVLNNPIGELELFKVLLKRFIEIVKEKKEPVTKEEAELSEEDLKRYMKFKLLNLASEIGAEKVQFLNKIKIENDLLVVKELLANKFNTEMTKNEEEYFDLLMKFKTGIY
jgi:hypothetical protein